MKGKKYGIVSLHKEFPSDEACLQFIFNARHSTDCSCGGLYRMRTGYNKFQCSKCRHAISPLAGTIFHKSDTALTTWFHAILFFSNAKSGISAKELQRELEVTYKCAWRMLNLIRKALPKDDEPLVGDVEVDTGYLGGKGAAGKNNVNLSHVMAQKSVVMAAIERKGRAKVEVVPDASAKTVKNFLGRNVSTHSNLMTDNALTYTHSAAPYKRESVNHSKGERVRGKVHINTVETFWSHVKRSIKGTHKAVSPKHLQTYLDGFVWHRNNCGTDRARFSALLSALLPSGIHA